MNGAQREAANPDAEHHHEIARMVLVEGRATTWLNHWSLLHADFDQLRKMDAVGVDGTLLQMTLGRMGHPVVRSSADLVLPHVFNQMEARARVALIGAAPGVAERAAARLSAFEVMAVDGYAGLAGLRRSHARLVDFDPRLVVVGLGAGLQELVAAKARDWLPRASVCTAGGWIDQFAASDQYFPDWVHRWRLGWAWRIAHEPRRLLGRYTVEAVDFLALAPRLVARLEDMGTFGEYGLIAR